MSLRQKRLQLAETIVSAYKLSTIPQAGIVQSMPFVRHSRRRDIPEVYSGLPGHKNTSTGATRLRYSLGITKGSDVRGKSGPLSSFIPTVSSISGRDELTGCSGAV